MALTSFALRRRGFRAVALGERGRSAERAAGARELRPVEHLAVERHDAGAARGLERGDDAPRGRDLVEIRAKRAIEDLDLRGVDRELADEAVAPRVRRLAREALFVPQVEAHGVEGRN